MSKLDHWTEETVDYAIHLLVRAERLLQAVAPELCEAVRKFLNEEV